MLNSMEKIYFEIYLFSTNSFLKNLWQKIAKVFSIFKNAIDGVP